MRVPFFMIVISAVACASIAGCGDDSGPSEPIVRPISIVELGGGEVDQVLEFPATVQAGLSAELGFEVPGKIIELTAAEGQEVEEGTVLARLDSRDFRSKLDSEVAKQAAAKAEFDRTRKLFEEQVTSQQQLDTRRRNYDVMKTNVERATKALADTELRAPFAGIVARVHVENFETVQAKQPILVVENDKVFEVTANVPEQDAARMPTGLSLEERTRRTRPEISVSALPGRVFPARISEFATTADPRTRTFAATLEFDNPGDVSLASGMTANVRVHVSDEAMRETGMFIPSVAVAADPTGQPIVWVVDPETMAVEARAVEVGAANGANIRVTSGLTGNEWVAASGVQFLHDGMVVTRLEK